jgi:diaminopimelate epimerase
MHGLGNDFVVLDARTRPLALDRTAAAALADRHAGIGADTIVVIEPAEEEEADVFVRFVNSDGSDAAACGNASRCVASLVMVETGRDRVRLATEAGLLDAWRAGDAIAVDMGRPRLGWRDIPLAREADTLRLPLDGPGGAPVGVNMGNPHAVFFVPDADALDIARLGPPIETDPLFPERTNVEFATVLSPDRIRMRVWERGVGVTLACGSGACATLVAAARRGLSARTAALALDGGDLTVEWRADDHVIMTGPVAESFSGLFDESLIAPRDPPLRRARTG